MIAGWLIWDSYQDRGNTVTIDFMSADGIVPGRTPVRYQGVEVGTVQDISLSDDLRKIEVKVSSNPYGEYYKTLLHRQAE